MTLGNLSKVVSHRIQKLRATSPAFDTVMGELCREGDIAIVGGAARDWLVGKEPRDLDVVVDATDTVLERIVKPHRTGSTRYGGHKLTIDGVAIDIWSVESTWAFSVRETLRATIENLPQTAFYNVDRSFGEGWKGLRIRLHRRSSLRRVVDRV